MVVFDSSASRGEDSRRRQRNALSKLGRVALERDDLEAVFDEALDAVRAVLGVDCCGLFTDGGSSSRYGRHVVLRRGDGWDDDHVAEPRGKVVRDERIERALTTGSPVVLEDPDHDRIDDSSLLGAHGIASGATVPIFVGSADGQAWGVLGAYASEPDAVDDEGVAFLARVAELLEPRIENADEETQLEGESDGTVETTVERITDAIFALDEEWRFTYANDRARTVIDPDGEGLLGECVWDRFPAAVDSTFEREYRDAMATQEPTAFEEYVPPLSTWFEVNAYPSESGLSVFFRDVTDRTEARRELRSTNRTLQRLYEITSDADRSFETKLHQLLELGRDRLDLDVGYLAAIDEEDDRFEITHCVSEDDQLEPGTEIALSETYCRQTIDSDGLLAFTNASTDERIDGETYETWGIDAYVGGRVTVGNDRFGTLCFESEEPRQTPFTPTERSFVELATQWVGQELERRRRERELEESERRYRTLIENFPNGTVALVDRDLQYVTFGGTLAGSGDVSRDELVGTPIERALPRELADIVVPNYENAIEGEPNTIERTVGGRVYRFHFAPVRGVDGDVFAAMGMSQEVTERRETERKLRERERHLERVRRYTDDLLDAIDDVFYVVDEDGELRRWNESLPAVTGYTDDEIDSMAALEFFAEEDRDVIADAIAGVFETGHSQVEAELVTKDGERIPYEFVASTLENPDGDAVLTGIGRDVTERRTRQRRLESLVADLEESNERLEQFAYAASHDLQEPLRMVSSYLTLIERRYTDELDADGREFIEFAVDGADRMQEMIDGLLAYSRVDTDTGAESFEPVDLEAVLADVLADLEVRIAETDADVTIESLPTVHGDPDQLRQLFQNLVDNALTYSGDRPPAVAVTAEYAETSNEPAWDISVRDEGIGIDPDDVDRIFQVFDRLHTVDEYAGTGIGLAICRRIVECHGGEIHVDSERGAGATFTVRLPTTAAGRARTAGESDSVPEIDIRDDSPGRTIGDSGDERSRYPIERQTGRCNRPDSGNTRTDEGRRDR